MGTREIDKAVILARGAGTRMRRADAAARLAPRQAAAADAGAKAMMPVGRPFVDYVLAGLADAGYRCVCLVVGPGPEPIRRHCRRLRATRIRIELAVQAEPRGTADAVAAAEGFAADDDFLVVNGDNYYPVDALAALRTAPAGSALAAFTRNGLLRDGLLSPRQVGQFAVVRTDAAGHLVRIIEKPREHDLAGLPRPELVSMNCWRFTRSIFDACRSIGPSPRGELELTDAVQFAVDRLGETFAVRTFDAPVLDLSRRADVAAVTERLARVEVRL